MGNSKRQLLEVVSPRLQYTGVSLDTPHGFSIESGTTYVVIGENGSGKTTLGRIIERGWNIGMNQIRGDKRRLSIKSIEFNDIHSLTGCADSYYQQRFESMMSDGIPTVGELIAGKIAPERWEELCSRLSITDILHKRVNFLSSGELRKFLIINMFTEIPDILIVDNPYIGLDAASRSLFNELLHDIACQGTAVILLLCNTVDIPPFTDFVLPMKQLTVGKMLAVADMGLAGVIDEVTKVFSTKGGIDLLPDVTLHEPIDYRNAFELRHCEVRYGSTVILHDVNWRVEAGDRWALLGENGSGKSTLLSLVYADNPQGYSNDITIFDCRRGCGESIWDIKRRIGYISPEMHLYFGNGEDTLTVVASGLHDNVGCFRRLSPEQLALARQWLDALGIGHTAGRMMRTLSSGEQRMALLARTFIKNAPLLILDEPLHGLDMMQKRLVAGVIARMLQDEGRTIIYVTHYEAEIPPEISRIKRLVKI
ncbi:MAG: ATP-binding cassette domain-containing protein [Bacteroidales bacterium]|nr:ATP-binding cassette domain-containing protein [Bacteroidales bacterium]